MHLKLEPGFTFRVESCADIPVGVGSLAVASRPYSVMVITEDSESSNSGSSPDRASLLLFLFAVLVVLGLQNGKASSEDRTRDLSLTKRMLCHLSYRGWWGGESVGVSKLRTYVKTFPTTALGFGGCAWLLWRSWQRVGLIIPRSRVRSSPGALLFLLQG